MTFGKNPRTYDMASRMVSARHWSFDTASKGDAESGVSAAAIPQLLCNRRLPSAVRPANRT